MQQIPSLPPNPYRIGTQKWRIYQRLARYGRVRNVEILLGLGGRRIMNTTGRASDVRRYLADYGIRLDCRPVNGEGVYEYEVRA